MTARLPCASGCGRTISAASYAKRFKNPDAVEPEWLCSGCWRAIPLIWRRAYGRLRRIERKVGAPLPECGRMWARLKRSARARVWGVG